MEMEQSSQLQFLDILVKRTPEGSLETGVYRKATDTDRILNFSSNHPRQHKASCVRTLFTRVDTHCSTPESRLGESQHLLSLFDENGYPRNFIKRCLRSKAVQHLQPSATQGINKPNMVVLPYMKNVSEMVARLLAKHRISVAHKPYSTIRQMLSRPKDRVPAGEKTNVVYRVDCSGCDNQYVGQTGRQLATRLHEHHLAANRHDQLSLISIHQDRYGHTFNLNDAKILATAHSKHAREFWKHGFPHIMQ